MTRVNGQEDAHELILALNLLYWTMGRGVLAAALDALLNAISLDLADNFAQTL
jgi:hypothetical protein